MKFFKYFLKWYSQCFQTIAESVLARRVKLKKIKIPKWQEELLIDKKCIKSAINILKENSSEIKKAVRTVFTIILKILEKGLWELNLLTR